MRFEEVKVGRPYWIARYGIVFVTKKGSRPLRHVEGRDHGRSATERDGVISFPASRVEQEATKAEVEAEKEVWRKRYPSSTDGCKGRCWCETL